MLADGLIKTLRPKIFKNFQRMIRTTWAGHFCPDGSVGAECGTSWKDMEGHENS